MANLSGMTLNELSKAYDLAKMQGDRELMGKIHSELLNRRGARNV
jgi:hypothetical protein